MDQDELSVEDGAYAEPPPTRADDVSESEPEVPAELKVRCLGFYNLFYNLNTANAFSSIFYFCEYSVCHVSCSIAGTKRSTSTPKEYI